MADVTKLGPMSVIAAADIADATHPINTEQSTQFNGQAGLGKSVGHMYLRDNGSDSYDIAIPLESGATGKWLIVGTGSAAEDGNSVVTPA